MSLSENKRKERIHRVALLGMLSAASLVLAAVESMIPTAGILPPGVKLGLSNIATMLTACFMGFSGAGVIALIKAGFAFITRGAVAGILSLSGGILSAAVICIVLKIKKNPFSLMGISILGAITHNIAQIAVVTFISASPAYLYLPVLILSAVAAGAVNGIILRGAFPYLSKINEISQNRKNIFSERNDTRDDGERT